MMPLKDFEEYKVNRTISLPIHRWKQIDELVRTERMTRGQWMRKVIEEAVQVHLNVPGAAKTRKEPT